MSVRGKALSLVALVGLVSGCSFSSAPQASDEPVTTNESVATDSTGIERAEAAAVPATVESQILASRDDAGVGLEIERGSRFTRLAIDTGAANPQADVMTLNNPPRLVVDMPAVAGVTNRSVLVENDNFVRGVRVGAHSNKTRLVFDLTDYAANPMQVDQNVDNTANRVVVTFAASGEAPQATLAAATPVTPEVIEPIVAADEAASEAQEPIEVAAAPEAAEPAVQSDSVLVDSLKFTKRANSPGYVSIALSAESPYQLEQTAPSEYVLLIPGAQASERTLLPQIAPQSFPGIRSARAVQQGENVAVRMFIDPGVKLTATPRGNEIAIAADSHLAAGARAQLADQPASPDSGAASTTSAEGESEIAASSTASGDGVLAADGSKTYLGRLISLDLQDTDIDNALRIIAEVSNLNIIASDDVQGKVTLRLIDVPWDQALDVILKTNGLDQVKEGNVIRIAPVDKLRAEREALKEAKKAAQELEDLAVNYIRVSYARVTDLKEQVEAVLSERGSVSVDERTNQLIIKDIQAGQADVMQLIKKLDLRTPQVLLETQIVEASRGLLRDLGFQWNFSYAASPQTGNATGLNFPNTVAVGGSGAPNGEAGSPAVNFPAVLQDAAGSAVTAILDSADGSRSLSARLSALESERKVRVISRPQVATVNNKQAQIKSVETVRVRLPDSGLSVATGAGASAQGGGSSAFEEIDVGIELTVTPQASPDYYVLMDINARSSTFGTQAVDNIPSTLEREATSTILVKSGQTFALGGVYRINDNNTLDGVPFLKDLPVLGAAFRRTLINNTDEELIFFITPHIVEGSFDPSLM